MEIPGIQDILLSTSSRLLGNSRNTRYFIIYFKSTLGKFQEYKIFYYLLQVDSWEIPGIQDILLSTSSRLLGNSRNTRYFIIYFKSTLGKFQEYKIFYYLLQVDSWEIPGIQDILLSTSSRLLGNSRNTRYFIIYFKSTLGKFQEYKIFYYLLQVDSWEIPGIQDILLSTSSRLLGNSRNTRYFIIYFKSTLGKFQEYKIFYYLLQVDSWEIPGIQDILLSTSSRLLGNSRNTRYFIIYFKSTLGKFQEYKIFYYLLQVDSWEIPGIQDILLSTSSRLLGNSRNTRYFIIYFKSTRCDLGKTKINTSQGWLLIGLKRFNDFTPIKIIIKIILTKNQHAKN